MKRLLIFLLLMMAMLSVGRAEGILPDDLEVIGEEAFRGVCGLEEIIIPGKVASICSKAFADTELKNVYIPASVTSIAQDAFDNISAPMLILTEPDSLAAAFALSNNIDFRADTECRALLIGQTDYPDWYKLNGPAKDVGKMKETLGEYEITAKMNLTAGEILDAISDSFAGAEDEDISLFYYSGHGNDADGSLIGIDMESYVTAGELREALDAIRGRKIVVIDACYSGALIGKALQQDETTDPLNLLIGAFASDRSARSSTLAAQQYFVLASSKGSEESWEAAYGGLFTEAFANSRGAADSDGDGVSTLDEVYLYVSENVGGAAAAAGKVQSVQVYPEGCRWFGLFR